MNLRINHTDLIDATADFHRRHNYGKPVTLITDPDIIGYPKRAIGLQYDRETRLWSEPRTGRTWPTLTLLELDNDYYECASCGRVCDIEIDQPTVILHDRPHCGSCWGAKIDGWNEGES